LDILNAADIKPLDASVPMVGVQAGSSRELIRWIFNDAKVGEVSEKPFQIRSGTYYVYVVPVVTNVYKEGIQDAARARSASEARIRQQKKAKLISDKIGSATTLDAVSKAVNEPVLKADSVSFGNPNITNVGREIKLSGAAFNKNNQAKISSVIGGESGIFIIQTTNVGAVPNPGMDVKSQQVAQQQTLRMVGQRNSVAENMKKSVSITDYRYKYF
jgi:peptidyl-prolyl cis-trans isomerase D